jgi:hypothetical protein
VNASGVKRRVSIEFCDFWRGLDKHDNFFYNLLSERFSVKVSERPEFLIYGNNGHVHRHFNCRKIYYTHEPMAPNFRECDFAFTAFHLDDPRHMRLPYYVVLHESPAPLIRGADFPAPEQILAGKTKFCSYIVSNNSPRRNKNRIEIFEKLSKYKRVESGGLFRNNVGGQVLGAYAGKIEFLRPCKFNIAFENVSLPGYTTEKLPHAMMARALPIYWGDPRVAGDFNPSSFINASKFPDLDALVEEIIRIDKDDSLYLPYFTQPYLPDNKPTEWYDRNRLLDRFEKILDTAGPSVTEQRRRSRSRIFSFGRWILVKRHDF